MLEIGQSAPGFELEDQNGIEISLSQFEGQFVVLYFYPKAMTKGCAIEARGFDDVYREIQDRNAVVLGVSADSKDQLREFARAEGIQFPLLSDPDGTVGSLYDSFGEVEFRGEMRQTPFRNTYIIRPNGTIGTAYENVSPEDHPERVLADLKAMQE